MANNDQYRVTKDTSARKNHEAAATQAGREAYYASIIAGLENDLKTAQTEHAAAITNLERENWRAVQKVKDELTSAEAQHTVTLTKTKNDNAQAMQKLKDQQQTLIDAAVTEAQADLNSKISNLESQTATLRQENNEVQLYLANEKADLKTSLEKVQGQFARAQSKAVAREDAHRKEIAEMKRKVWLQIHFKSTRCQMRTYWFRPTAHVREAVTKLMESGIKYSPNNLLSEKKIISRAEYGMTWEQLGIEDGDEITFE